MNPAYILEACVDNYEDATAVWKKGAHQLEICNDLAAEGLTPEKEVLTQILHEVNIPCKVMIRVRSGDFIYSADEIKTMIASVLEFKSFGIAGYVFGALMQDKNGTYNIDMEAMAAICRAAYPLPVTCHKAIDLCEDITSQVRSLMQLKNLSFILSSGGATTAAEGQHTLIEMQKAAGNQISIIAAGKITPKNLPMLIDATALRYYHGKKIV